MVRLFSRLTLLWAGTYLVKVAIQTWLFGNTGAHDPGTALGIARVALAPPLYAVAAFHRLPRQRGGLITPSTQAWSCAENLTRATRPSACCVVLVGHTLTIWHIGLPYVCTIVVPNHVGQTDYCYRFAPPPPTSAVSHYATYEPNVVNYLQEDRSVGTTINCCVPSLMF